FLVLFNLLTFKFVHRTSGGRGRLSLQSQVVLRFTGYLLLAAFAIFLALEWNGVLGGMDPGRKLYTAFYQAVTPRTCGFCLVPTESLKPITRLVYEVLMFIGGAPGSAAAGIKVTTFAILIYTLLALCRGDHETIISNRSVPMDTVRESIVIFMALAVFITLVVGVLLVTEDGRGIPTDALFFEACSAITTTGLSMGDTTMSLSVAGRICIICAMFVGRLGALSVVMMIGDRESRRHVRYPMEELVVG
ncbi:MAG: Trk family potassium uptake protein, partial [Kiritimatiellae bacterium]|nr:Trk family potassium uptake protein [Kiritimatiellia bacterium]